MKRKILRSILLTAACFCAQAPLAATVVPVNPPASKSPAPRVFAPVELGRPVSLAVDVYGGIYVGDLDGGVIFKITPHGRAIQLGGQTALQVSHPVGLALNRAGDLFVADADDNQVHRVGMDGLITPLVAPESAAMLKSPTDSVADASGNVYVANEGDFTILKIDHPGAATVFAGKSGESGSADGPAADARFAKPRGIAMDAAGNLYVSDEENCNIRKITPDGTVTTLAGPSGARKLDASGAAIPGAAIPGAAGEAGSADGVGSAARFDGPRCLTAGPDGAVYVADTNNCTIRKITPDGAVTTLAGAAGQSGFADGSGAAARFSEPRGIAVDAAGTIFIADTLNCAIRQIAPGGAVTTIAGKMPESPETKNAAAIAAPQLTPSQPPVHID